MKKRIIIIKVIWKYLKNKIDKLIADKINKANNSYKFIIWIFDFKSK